MTMPLDGNDSNNRGLLPSPILERAFTFKNDPQNIPDALDEVKLDFTVRKDPAIVHCRDAEGLKCYNADGSPVLRESDTHFNIVRNDNNIDIGMTGKQYASIDNVQVASIIAPIVDAGEVKFIAAIVRNNGAQIMLFMDVPSMRFDVVPGDMTYVRLVLKWSHDGSCKVVPATIMERYICSNVSAAVSKGARETGLSIPHKGNVIWKVDQARGIMAQLKAQSEAYTERARFLASKDITRGYARQFIEHLLPSPTDGSKCSTRLLNQRDALHSLANQGPGTEIQGVRGTRWGLYNAVTAYVTHDRGSKNPSARAQSVMFGSGNTFAQKGLDYLLAD